MMSGMLQVRRPSEGSHQATMQSASGTWLGLQNDRVYLRDCPTGCNICHSRAAGQSSLRHEPDQDLRAGFKNHSGLFSICQLGGCIPLPARYHLLLPTA